ncbi:unnamed protein product [Phytophthora lilii]|uniref:Unnamed protein product n=1 Tax=Phytophthora lilii TaxID=2077276 RepID=A0A9W6UFH0_9STRA|nr:unnamed protein product [Phytophthora lilii]
MLRQVWFQLRDEENNSIGSADSVDCADDAMIAQFQRLLKNHCPNILAQVDAPSLTVYENEAACTAKQALESTTKVRSLGGSKEDAVVVQVPQRDTFVHVRRNLSRVKVPFATRELNHLFNKDTTKYILLGSFALTREEALQIRASARSAIKSATQRAIAIREGVLLDGPLHVSQGQAKSSFYYAYSRFGGILAAKVYGEKYLHAFQTEVEVNLALGSHDNIVQFLKSFSIKNADNEPRHIIVMPFFARSAADLLALQSPIELRALVTIARDCISALCHIHSRGYCFADLKPANIMLRCGEQGGATLVDFGGTVRLGVSVVEITEPFCLDAPTLQGSELLDWTCLGTTLAQLAGIDISVYYSRLELALSLKDGDHSVNKLVEQLIVSCLEDPCQRHIEAALTPLLNSLSNV